MRISDWSSDVCSSDLTLAKRRQRIGGVERRHVGGEHRVGHRISLKIARTGLASAPTMRSGSATSSYRPGGTSSSASPSNIRISVAFTARSEEHTSELQSLMRISYAVFCLKKKTKTLEKYI